jgi:apolipoprotein N-acyltransferase
MAKNLYGAGPGQKQVVVVRPRPKEQKRFRWWLIWLPASIICLAWLMNGIHVGHAWDGVMSALGVHNRERYSLLAVLGLVCVAAAAVARILRSGSRKEE